MSVDVQNDAGAGREIELKLEVIGGDPLAITRRAVFKKHLTGAWQKAHNDDLYWDTGDRRLRRAGLTLRTRNQEGGRLLQTLKAKQHSRGVALERLEWEMPIDAEVPDLAAFDDLSIFDELGAVWPHELHPVFRVKNNRKRATFGFPGQENQVATIEIAIDDCEIEDLEHREDQSKSKINLKEVELELKFGSMRALAEFAAELRSVIDFRLSRLSKAERGFALIDNIVPVAVMAKDQKLDPEMAASDALRIIIERCIGLVLDNIQPALDGRDTEGIHQLRVGLRRAGATLKLFKSLIDKPTHKRWSKMIGERRKMLGKARDLDVLRDEILASLPEREPYQNWLKPLLNLLDAERKKAQDDLTVSLRGAVFTNGLMDILLEIEGQAWRQLTDARPPSNQHMTVIDLARIELTTAQKRANKIGKKPLDSLPIETIHELRIRLKGLRYGVDFFVCLFPKKTVRPYLKKLKALQDLLGELNDISVAETELLALIENEPSQEAALAVGFVVGWYQNQLKLRLSNLQSLWNALAEQKPFWQHH